jgi:hypothetical protein
MERPAEFRNRAFLTDEEIAQREKATADRRFKLDNRPPAAQSPDGPGGAGGNYMTKSPDRLFEYACHEGNYSLTNILAGARAKENAAGGR